MEIRHIPPQGQSMIGLHTHSEKCSCEPKVVRVKKQQSTGRAGHQGHKTARIDVIHELI